MTNFVGWWWGVQSIACLFLLTRKSRLARKANINEYRYNSQYSVFVANLSSTRIYYSRGQRLHNEAASHARFGT